MAKIKNLKQQVGTVDIRTFMRTYYGISHSDIGRMTHETASLFFPDLCRTSFTYVEKNPELVGCGEIVLVRDTNNNIAPYVVPEIKLFVEQQPFAAETLIEYIITSLKITSELSESAVILIEGQDSLDDLVGKDKLTRCTRDLPSTLVEVINESDIDGVVVNIDGAVNKLKLRQHTLEELSFKTDSIAIILEDDQSITLVVNGVSQHDYDFIMLRADLYSCLDSIEFKIEEKSSLLESPSCYQLSEMSNYELTILMKSYKANKQFDYYNVVRRELIKRTKKNKQSKRNKVKQMRKKYRGDE